MQSNTNKFSVNGGWGAWTSWSLCGDNCQKTRVRNCNNPAPVNGGQNCIGNRIRSTACSGGNCRGKLRILFSSSSNKIWFFSQFSSFFKFFEPKIEKT